MSSTVRASPSAPITTNIIEVAAPPDVVTDMPPTSTSVKASATPRNPESAHEDSVLPCQAATHAPIDTNWVNKLTEAEWVDLMDWVIEGRRMLFNTNESRGIVKLEDIVDLLMTNEKDFEAVYDLLDTIQEEKEKAREQDKNEKEGGKDGIKEPALEVISAVTAEDKLCVKQVAAMLRYPIVVAVLTGCAIAILFQVHHIVLPKSVANEPDSPVLLAVFDFTILATGMAVLIHWVLQGLAALVRKCFAARATADKKKTA